MAISVQNKGKLLFSGMQRRACLCMYMHTRCLLGLWEDFSHSSSPGALAALLQHSWSASGRHLDPWAVWTSTKPSSTRAVDNMAMLKADSSSLQVVVTEWCRGLDYYGNNMRKVIFLHVWVQSCKTFECIQGHLLQLPLYECTTVK